MLCQRVLYVIVNMMRCTSSVI